MILSSLVTAFFVYSVLSYLFVESKISISVSIIISILVYALTYYYNTTLLEDNKIIHSRSLPNVNNLNEITENNKIESSKSSNLIFVTIFASSIIVCSLNYSHDFHIFTNWNEINSTGLIQLGAAIMLCFFVPGYAIVQILTRKHTIKPILSILLGYLFSILIAALTAYISALVFGSAISHSSRLFIAIYVGILALYLVFLSGSNDPSRIIQEIKRDLRFHRYNGVFNLPKSLRSKASELTVFGSLFMLIVVSTYLLYGGTTIGDQWYHQGRALLFMSGAIRESVLSGAEGDYYPPFQSALLAALATLSGIPLVNTYASIAFLNVMPMFAFYYLFVSWVPVVRRKAVLLACSLFILSSGFGWVYLLNTASTHPITSEQSSLSRLGSIADLDIISATNFVIPTAPDFSTALIYIALPAGFILLAMIRMTFDNKFANIFIVSAISFLGILSHYEFYIFVIIASILPAIFKLKAKSYVYVSLLIAISAVYILDITTPANYYIYLDILGIPLILLAALFVTITWLFYLCTPYLQKIIQSKLTFQKFAKTNPVDRRLKLVTVTIIVFIVAYVYLLSFIVIDQIPLGTIREHTNESSLPWYLYPMRMGVAGLLGLVFILSYFFKKYEKQVFIFGIIIMISFVMGPYYDEARFSKYTMMGIIGFASLMIFKLLTWRTRFNPILNTVIISTIVICSGMSILIFVGYSSLILQTQDFTNTLSRRHFPTNSELNLLEGIRNITNTDSTKYNVISTLNEYDRRNDGIMSKVSSFVGLPYDKLRETPLALNASSIDRLYHHLEYGDVMYILLPRHNVNYESSESETIRFVLDNFKQVYQDKNYTVLEVPPIRGPTSIGKHVAIAYDDSSDLSLLPGADASLLEFNNKTFNLKEKDESILIRNLNGTATVLLVSKDNSTNLWSKTIDPIKRINSIEAKFQINSEAVSNDTGYVGLRWYEGDDKYNTKLSNSGFELYQKLRDDQHFKLLFNSTEVVKKGSLWYTVNVQSLNNSVKLFVDGILKIEIPKSFKSENQSITKIGLTSDQSNVEFKPIKIWSASELTQINGKTKYYNYDYPLSILALSNSTYDIYKKEDFSIFSNDIIFISENSVLNDDVVNKYLEYIRSGGTVVVFNSDSNFNGTFSQLFSIRSNQTDEVQFTNIDSNRTENLSINIPGLVSRLDLERSPDLKVNAWYRNSDNEIVAPFIIEKTFSKGKIVLVNAKGYFNAVSTSSNQYFSSLSNISRILALEGTDVMPSEHTSLPMEGFVGNMETYGKIMLNSTSISLLYEDNNNHYPVNVSKMVISNGSKYSPLIMDNLLIKNILSTGRYQVLINHTGMLKLPDLGSDNKYVSFTIPSHFNMTLRLYPQGQSNIEVTHQNNRNISSLLINNNSKVEFYDVKSVAPLKFVPMTLKNPEISVEGHTRIKNSYFDGYLTGSGALDDGVNLDFQGNFKTRLAFTDHYNEHYRSGIRSNYISYLDWVDMIGSTGQNTDALKLPGDIPAMAIKNGDDLPLMKILTSSTNVIIFTSLILATIIAIWISRRLKPTISNNN